MKMVLISSAVAIAIGVVAYVILTNSGMDTASVYSGPDVRLQAIRISGFYVTVTGMFVEVVLDKKTSYPVTSIGGLANANLTAVVQ